MKIICIGRNYAEHAKEMKSDVPTEPVYFMKPQMLKDIRLMPVPGLIAERRLSFSTAASKVLMMSASI